MYVSVSECIYIYLCIQVYFNYTLLNNKTKTPEAYIRNTKRKISI